MKRTLKCASTVLCCNNAYYIFLTCGPHVANMLPNFDTPQWRGSPVITRVIERVVTMVARRNAAIVLGGGVLDLMVDVPHLL